MNDILNQPCCTGCAPLVAAIKADRDAADRAAEQTEEHLTARIAELEAELATARAVIAKQ